MVRGTKGIETQCECGIAFGITVLEKQMLELPKLQKISMMEKLWVDLSKGGDRFEVSEWHMRELEETEQRLEEGEEQFEDWSEAKVTRFVRLQILTAASRDLLRGKLFYELQNDGLGEYFLDTLFRISSRSLSMVEFT